MASSALVLRRQRDEEGDTSFHAIQGVKSYLVLVFDCLQTK